MPEALSEPVRPLISRLLQRFLGLFFDLLYHQFAWTYDLVSWLVSWGQWQTWIRLSLPYLHDGPILELGSGPGHLLLEGLKAGKHMVGLDFSPQMLKIAGKRLTRSGYAPLLTRGDGRFLPYPSRKFKTVVATFPTEYIFTSQALKEIHRVLDDSGEFICIPMAWINEKGLIFRFLGWLFRITGQSKDLNQLHLEPSLKPFAEAGFELKWDIIPLKHSNVILLTASKHARAAEN